MSIDYDHANNLHTLEGARHALSTVLARLPVRSVLDVGCGGGVWLKAALDYGIEDIAGVDGVSVPAADLHVPSEYLVVRDLSQPLDLGRTFDLVLCLEVAEHLDAGSALELVATLTRHSDTVLFSAACPGQPGQHHVHCEWPAYWQGLFNDRGFVCSDWPRLAIWADDRIEPWYRQNMFIAVRNPAEAGREERIRAIVHPDLLRALQSSAIATDRRMTLSKIANGEMPLGWHLLTLTRGLWRKAVRRVQRVQEPAAG